MGIVLLDGKINIFHLGMTGKFIFCKNNRNYESMIILYSLLIKALF